MKCPKGRHESTGQTSANLSPWFVHGTWALGYVPFMSLLAHNRPFFVLFENEGQYVPIYVPFRDWDPLQGEGHMSRCSAG